jgi:hypothetical protein
MTGVVWQSGDDWRVLSLELVSTGAVTVMSVNGTCRLLDLNSNRQCRIPTAHKMLGDLAGVIATPCGLVTSTGDPGGYHTTTPMRLAVTGLDPDLASSAAGRAALAAPWAAPRHGPDPCSTPYCALVKGLTSHAAESACGSTSAGAG